MSNYTLANHIKSEIHKFGLAGIPQAVVSGLRNPEINPNTGLGLGSANLTIMDTAMASFPDPSEKVQALIGCIEGLGQARAYPELKNKIKDSMVLAIGFQILKEIDGGSNIAAMIVEQGLETQFLKAIEEFAPGGTGIVYLADRCLSSPALVYPPKDGVDKKLPGFVLVDKMLDIYPQYAQRADVSTMFKSLAWANEELDFRSEEEAKSAARVACHCLGYWLDNPKEKPYKLHFASGPKENTTSVLGGLAMMVKKNVLGEADLMELTRGSRAGRLDKTLARGVSLVRKDSQLMKRWNIEDLEEIRILIKVKALEGKAGLVSRKDTVSRPAM